MQLSMGAFFHEAGWATILLMLLVGMYLVIDLDRISRRLLAAWRDHHGREFLPRAIASYQSSQTSQHLASWFPALGLVALVIYSLTHADLCSRVAHAIGASDGDWNAAIAIGILVLGNLTCWWRPFVWTPASTGPLRQRIGWAISKYVEWRKVGVLFLIVSLTINIYLLWNVSLWTAALILSLAVQGTFGNLFAALKKSGTGTRGEISAPPEPEQSMAPYLGWFHRMK